MCGGQYRSSSAFKHANKTTSLGSLCTDCGKSTTLPHDSHGFAEHDCCVSNLLLSMIKHELRPAHRPGQTRLCLPPPLAPVPGKLVRKLNSKLVQNPLVQCFSLYQSKKRQQSAQLSVPSKQGVTNSGPYCCSLNNLWTGVSFTCLLLIGVLRI